MHEAGIALNLIEAVQSRLEALPHGHVAAIHVTIGELSGVSAEALEFAFHCLAAGTSLETTRLVFEVVPLAMRCDACGRTSPVADLVFRCPACGSERTTVVGGRELEVRTVDVADVPAEPEATAHA